MQRLDRQRPQVVPPLERLFAPGGQLVPRGRREVEGEEQPRPRRAGPLLSQNGASWPTSTRRRRCIATVVERSRISVRSPGRRVSRASVVPSDCFTHQQT